VFGCVRVDVSRPVNGERFELGEVSRRLYRALAGLPAGSTAQIVVGPDTPTHSLQLPDAVRVQVVAPDASTLRAWLAALSEAAQ